MYVAEVSDKIANDIPKRIFLKMSRNKSFYFIARFEVIYSVSKTRDQYWQSALDLRIRKHRGLSRNFDMMARSTSKKFVSKSQSNFTAEL